MRGTPTVLAMTRPIRIAHSTYSILGRAMWCALPYASMPCSMNLPANPMTNRSAMPGTSSRKRRGNPIGCSSAVIATDMTASPGNARQDGERDQKDERGGGEDRPRVDRDGDAAGDRLL